MPYGVPRNTRGHGNPAWLQSRCIFIHTRGMQVSSQWESWVNLFAITKVSITGAMRAEFQSARFHLSGLQLPSHCKQRPIVEVPITGVSFAEVAIGKIPPHRPSLNYQVPVHETMEDELTARH